MSVQVGLGQVRPGQFGSGSVGLVTTTADDNGSGAGGVQRERLNTTIR